MSNSCARLTMACPALTVPFVGIYPWKNDKILTYWRTDWPVFFSTFGSPAALSSRDSDAKYLQEEAAILQCSMCVYRTIIRTEFRNSAGGKWKKKPSFRGGQLA